MSYLVENVYSAESTEWYTPAEYIALVKRVLGSIDLDPASSALANKTVQAERYYDIQDNGLMHPWHAETLFLNPPYGRWGDSRQVGQTEIWIRSLLEQYHLGHTKQAILLVNASLYKRWFEPLWQFPICFPTGRLSFVSPSGKFGRSPHSSAFVYLGEHELHFANVFDEIGPVVKRMHVAQRRYATLWGREI